MNNDFEKKIRLSLLNLLKDNPQMTQREMNRQMGISLGKVNYCLTKLSEKGMIKAERFKKSNNKSAYMYRLTPQGFEEITKLTCRFLKQKIKEYDAIKKEIKNLSESLYEIDPELPEIPELKKQLNRIK